MSGLAKIDQALVSRFIAGGFGLPVAHENLPFTPSAGQAYAELRVLQNDVTPLSLADSNQTDGVFRAILRYPAQTGAVAANLKADQILTAYPIGARLSYGGQSITVTSHSRQPGAPEEGWHKINVTIGYRAALRR